MTAKAGQAADDRFLHQVDPDGELRRTDKGGSTVTRSSAQAALCTPCPSVGHGLRPKEGGLSNS